MKTKINSFLLLLLIPVFCFGQSSVKGTVSEEDSGLPLLGAQHCAETCGSNLLFDNCKLCDKSITGASLGSATSESDTCRFCPSGLDPSS